jgi:hypothetical protein
LRQLALILLFVQLGVALHCQNPIADFEVIINYKCGYATTEFKNHSVNADTFLWVIEGNGYYYETFEPRGSNIGTNKKCIVTLIAKGNGLSDTLSKEIKILNTKVKFDKILADTNSYAPRYKKTSIGWLKSILTIALHSSQLSICLSPGPRFILQILIYINKDRMMLCPGFAELKHYDSC